MLITASILSQQPGFEKVPDPGKFHILSYRFPIFSIQKKIADY
jgi:hypothetical protein